MSEELLERISYLEATNRLLQSKLEAQTAFGDKAQALITVLEGDNKRLNGLVAEAQANIEQMQAALIQLRPTNHDSMSGGCDAYLPLRHYDGMGPRGICCCDFKKVNELIDTALNGIAGSGWTNEALKKSDAARGQAQYWLDTFQGLVSDNVLKVTYLTDVRTGLLEMAKGLASFPSNHRTDCDLTKGKENCTCGLRDLRERAEKMCPVCGVVEEHKHEE